MSDKKIDGLFVRYEARLEAMMTKILGRAALQLVAFRALVMMGLVEELYCAMMDAGYFAKKNKAPKSLA